MTELSSTAQAVLDAATVPTGDFCLENVNEIVAAALRALADQIDWDWEPAEQLRHIAAELEAAQ